MKLKRNVLSRVLSHAIHMFTESVLLHDSLIPMWASLMSVIFLAKKWGPYWAMSMQPTSKGELPTADVTLTSHLLIIGIVIIQN